MNSISMATGKQSFLLFFVVLIAGTSISYSAFHLPVSREPLQGRRVLLEVTEKMSLKPAHTFIKPSHTYSQRILGAQIQVAETGSVDDYGPPGSNPPYHQDPPTPSTMKSVHEMKSIKTGHINTDYASLKPDPSPGGHDYPAPDTNNFRTDYATIGPHLTPANHDYPSPATMTFHTSNACSTFQGCFPLKFEQLQVEV